MVNADYIPDRGDVVWLDFNPQTGHEQMGRRPAIVISPAKYNEKTSLAILCPITTQIKGYPFEVKIPENDNISGVILSDQVKSLDWRVRNAEFITKTPEKVIQEVMKKLNLLIS
jgi:mRNA interferase MazF